MRKPLYYDKISFNYKNLTSNQIGDTFLGAKLFDCPQFASQNKISWEFDKNIRLQQSKILKIDKNQIYLSNIRN